MRVLVPITRPDWWACFRPLGPGPFYDVDTDALDWGEYYPLSPDSDLVLHRRTFQGRVDDWIECLKMRPQLLWDGWDAEEASPRLILSGGSLLESVVAHVLFALTGTRSLITCDACGSFLEPKRRPRDNERYYCAKCGRKAAVRDATSDWGKGVNRDKETSVSRRLIRTSGSEEGVDGKEG